MPTRQSAPESMGPSETIPKNCFLCQKSCTTLCPFCMLVYFCCTEHFDLHHVELNATNSCDASAISTTTNDQANRIPYCFPYRADYKEGIGRILVATRNIKPMELVLVDPGTVQGPNYTSKPVCLECLHPVSGDTLCNGCEYPTCSKECSSGPRHSEECPILARCPRDKRPPTLQIKDSQTASNALSVVTPLRLLLLQEKDGDMWQRSNQLMDHISERQENTEEWEWYERFISNYFRNQLGLADRFTSEEIHHAIGLINVNAVALQFPKQSSLQKPPMKNDQVPEGKGLYPIFAIMSHYCVCNARYTLNPTTLMMYVRARSLIRKGEEISVQYLSALLGNFKRRRKIKEEWYFDCKCRRCSDPTECSSFVSAVKCNNCFTGNVLPVNSLDYDSKWKCLDCGQVVEATAIESLLKPIEEQLEEIGTACAFESYEHFIETYSDVVLNSNHYLLMTAARNLIQFYTYSTPNETLCMEKLEKKFELCQRFDSVLSKIDPGYSEIRTFIQKELNFTRLLLSQKRLAAGILSTEDYLRVTRQSLKALDDIERCKQLLLFNCG